MALDAFNNGNGVAGARLAEDALPIFDVLRVQLDFSIAASFVAAQVANNVLVLALSNGRILRIDLNRPQDIDGTLSRSSSPPLPFSSLLRRRGLRLTRVDA